MPYRARVRPLRIVVAALTAFGAAALAWSSQATTMHDPVGDILPTFKTFPGDPSNHSDLDVVTASATRDATHVFLSSTQNGPVGLTKDGIYVWGVDRGSGVDFLADANPSVGKGVKFDTFIVLKQDGTAQVNLVTFSGRTPTGVMTSDLDPGSVTIDGNTISVVVPLSKLPSAGAGVGSYRFNVWPRYLTTATTDRVADFAPDRSTFTASVPEPASWALMVGGFGLLGATLRRRRAELA